MEKLHRLVNGVAIEFSEADYKEYANNQASVELEKLSNAKVAKRTQINAIRDARMAKDVFGKVSGNDYYFQRNITTNLAWINHIESSEDIVVTNWVTADNQIIDITKADLISICAHIRDRDTQAVVQARRAKDALALLSTLAEVEAFDINQVFE